MRSELIISTYNNPKALRLCLVALRNQLQPTDTICIADDGSGPETAEVVQAEVSLRPEAGIRHVWHSDTGFRKAKILNDAIASSTAEFLIFLDGDCMVHPVFLKRHFELARPDRFSSGGFLRLPKEASESVTEDMVEEGTVFAQDWLQNAGALNRYSNKWKAGAGIRAKRALLEHITPVRRYWCGGNSSAFRDKIMAVNGFDTRITYGGGDKEFGERLSNSGVRGRHLRFTAPILHLYHDQPYKSPAEIKENRKHTLHSRKSKSCWTDFGIREREASAR
ncbi:glycosyltransferase [Actibacterium pelagium]|uniref:Glycosyl transferase family 2 n=1 Tax=Actibacterium pelagium TaxID=2029103 RepID=A0A917AAX2_9RHOB|nr:glycosyltransferase [Actibacterium pelagium]GGE38949.1 hypothetical protein GCM10011517_03380 [Actibacterium pelagium]